MKKLALAATLTAMVVAVPAQAKPDDPGAHRADQAGAQHGAGKSEGKRRGRCAPRKVGYVAFGTYVSGELTQTAGADTAAARDDRYSGTLVVMVKRTNKHGRADKGKETTYTLTDAKLRLADRDGDGTRDLPVAGDRVGVSGKITRLKRRCDATGFEPVVSVRQVNFHKPAEQQAPAPAPAPEPEQEPEQPAPTT